MSGLINKIRIHQLRGIKDLEIQLSGGNLLILGENGTGKSSVIDSLELLFTETIEKIAGRQDVPLKEAIPFHGSDHERWVEVELSKEIEHVRLSYTSSSKRSTIPASCVNVFEIASSRPFILHRYQLLAFVEDRAAGRYKRLSTLIGMDLMDEIVDSWKQAHNTFEKNYQNAESEENDTLKELQSWLRKKISSHEEVCNEVNQFIVPLGLSSILKRTEILERQRVLKGKFSPVNFTRAEALRTILTRVEETSIAFTAFFLAYETLFSAWQNFLEQSSKVTDAAYENILVDGKKVISELSLDICPLCESEIKDRVELLERIDYRLGALHALIHARQKMESETNKTKKSIFGAQESVIRLGDALAAGAMQNIEGMLSTEKSLKDIESKLENQVFSLDSTDSIRNLFDLFLTTLQETKKSVSAEAESLNPSDDEKKILDANNFLARTDEKWQDWEEKRDFTQKELVKFEQIKIIYQQLIKARKDGIQSILNGLQSEFIRMYNLLHPGEGHKAISILMAENKDNSAELLAEMDGMRAIHPLANYSEGHLDSMGLCIFLSLIKKFNGDLKLIVLDDVLTSIDAGHRLRVAKLIASEFKDYQIVISTHDEFWANELDVIFKNEHIPLKTIRMNPWTKEDGATYNEYITTDWEYYKELIKNGKRLDAIAGAGRALERFLFTMRRNLHLEVPATLDDRYTIGDLYGPFFSWVNKKKIQRQDIPDFASHLILLNEDLDDYWRFRNWSGAHYNVWGEQVSQKEASRFVEIVEEIISTMQCPSCSALVVYDIKGKIIRCPNCEPSSSKKGFSVYNSKWKHKVSAILETNYANPKKQTEKPKTTFIMTQKAIDACLQDARRKFGLALPATIDDQYKTKDIYDAFLAFLIDNPRKGYDSWSDVLNGSVQAISSWMSETKEWIEKGLDENQALEFYTAAKNLTELLECDTCGDLLHFDKTDKKYYCNKCDNQSVLESSSAYWFTE